MKQQILLLDDVHGLGRSGDVVTAKPGFIRNFLLPKKRAVIADKHTLKMQTKLREEREKKAAQDRKEAETFAAKLKSVVIETEVKVDPEGRMYGSVTATELAQMLKDSGHALDKKNIVLPHAIKTLGTHSIALRLREGVEAKFTLEVKPEGGVLPEKVEAPPAEPSDEEVEA